MDDNLNSDNRRRLLTIGSLAGAGIATAAIAVPFIGSFSPGRKTLGEGAPVEVALGNLEPARLFVIPWRRKPVWILLRSEEMLSSLDQDTDRLLDPESQSSVQPDYCQNATRSINPEIFVALGVCTHLGCSPGLNGEAGFLCACHGSNFDFAGRVFKGSPAPKNLIIPEHYYLNDDALVIGESKPV